MSVHDDDLSDLERRMRAKLLGGSEINPPDRLSEEEQRIARKLFADRPDPSGPKTGSVGQQSTSKPAVKFSQEEAKIAERLLGHDNARRLSAAKEGRRVYVAPVRVTYEWYMFQAGAYRDDQSWHWRINRLENGRCVEAYATGSYFEELNEAVNALKSKGVYVHDANLDRGPPTTRKPVPSKRKAIINELRFYRP